MSRARCSSFSYVADRPPTMWRMPANTSLNTFAPRMASPVTMPRYFVIRRPSIPGVVVVSMVPFSTNIVTALSGIGFGRLSVDAHAMDADADEASEDDRRNDGVRESAETHDPDDGRARHGAGEKSYPDQERAGHEDQRRSRDLEDAGQVPEPLAEPDLIEQLDPHRARVALAASDREEHDRNRDPQDPCNQHVLPAAGLYGNELEFGHDGRFVSSCARGASWAGNNRARARRRDESTGLALVRVRERQHSRVFAGQARHGQVERRQSVGAEPGRD